MALNPTSEQTQDVFGTHRWANQRVSSMRLWLVKIQLAMFTFSSRSAFLNGYKMIAYFLYETVLAARKPKVLLKTSTRLRSRRRRLLDDCSEFGHHAVLYQLVSSAHR